LRLPALAILRRGRGEGPGAAEQITRQIFKGLVSPLQLESCSKWLVRNKMAASLILSRRHLP
jgi:hypothetical protein